MISFEKLEAIQNEANNNINNNKTKPTLNKRFKRQKI
jgi:hypothetical protein